MPTLFPPAEYGYVRVAACVPEHRVAHVDFNTQKTIELARQAAAQGARIALFPELGITSYTSADLFYQSHLLQAAKQALLQIAAELANSQLLIVVGAPLELDGRIYNCAVALNGGAILGVVPKQYLPTTQEYYEKRWFTSALNMHPSLSRIHIGQWMAPFGTNLLFQLSDAPHCKVGIEICEDLWAVNPPSGDLALAGATILLNPSASDELLGKADYRRELVRSQSARCLAAYVYSGCGPGESTTDVVFGGHALIAENGSILAESDRFNFDSHLTLADVDIDRLNHERRTNSSFSFGGAISKETRIIGTPPTNNQSTNNQSTNNQSTNNQSTNNLLRPLLKTPFVPTNKTQRDANCREIFAIQSTALAKRLRHTGTKHVTIGLSGGLDSTLALLVILRAYEKLNLPLSGIHAITMPGFGTTVRTKSNAVKLSELLGVSLRTISIADAVRQHFKDIGHDMEDHDVVFENAQARERTQILMDVANQIGGFVVGTGDLSELALGWMTFNADHMSMYHVNAGVPKTLVRYIIEWAAESEFSGDVSSVLRDVADTPITPELLPLDDKGNLQQQTEETIGPYILHDFFLYQIIRNGFAPRKVFFLAQQVFVDEYSDAVLLKWLRNFYKRFWANQFKRSVMPDGPKVGSVALSPRGDWRMPSDASVALWMREVDALETNR
jgi:NAD+ synthase (glutamine-hydrolysing)